MWVYFIDTLELALSYYSQRHFIGFIHNSQCSSIIVVYGTTLRFRVQGEWVWEVARTSTRLANQTRAQAEGEKPLLGWTMFHDTWKQWLRGAYKMQDVAQNSWRQEGIIFPGRQDTELLSSCLQSVRNKCKEETCGPSLSTVVTREASGDSPGAKWK